MQPISKSNWIEGTILEQKNWTDSLASIKIDAKVNPYISGQFTRIALAKAFCINFGSNDLNILSLIILL